jgi:hypothetical protein
MLAALKLVHILIAFYFHFYGSHHSDSLLQCKDQGNGEALLGAFQVFFINFRIRYDKQMIKNRKTWKKCLGLGNVVGFNWRMKLLALNSIRC